MNLFEMANETIINNFDETMSRLGIAIRRRDSQYIWGTCPNASNHNHGDKTPSLMIKMKGNKIDCYCQSCQVVSGDGICLVGYVNNLTNKEAAKWVLDEFNVPYQYSSNKKNNHKNNDFHHWNVLGLVNSSPNIDELGGRKFDFEDLRDKLGLEYPITNEITPCSLEKLRNLNRSIYNEIIARKGIAMMYDAFEMCMEIFPNALSDETISKNLTKKFNKIEKSVNALIGNSPAFERCSKAKENLDSLIKKGSIT